MFSEFFLNLTFDLVNFGVLFLSVKVSQSIRLGWIVLWELLLGLTGRGIGEGR
jgi:hypothetical protein